MPAAGAIDTTATPARIRVWLLDHPGQHRAVDVAKGLGLPTQKVANALGRLARDGAVTRERVTVEGRSLPITKFELPRLGMITELPSQDS